MPASTVSASRLALAVAALLTPAFAHATNGYFTHGTSIKSDGIAGIGVALPQDALAAASNPAGTAEVGERLDIGATWFAPRRSADIVGNGAGSDAHYSGNGEKNFFLPEIGYTHPLGARAAWGIALYGNGGMNTSYDANPYARFGASGKAGVNLEQLFVTPSFAYRLDEHNDIGIGLNFVYQRFEAKGIGLFGNFSQSSQNVSDNGIDSSTGVGARIGWLGHWDNGISAGLSYASKVHTSAFEKYKGLFAEQGSFDVPANYAAGLTWKVNPVATLAAEVQRIEYSQVRSIADTLSPLLQGVALGADNGAGFGWKDVTVAKLGVQFALTPTFTARFGISHATQPIPDSQTFFSILAPGVVQNHLTVGATWTTARGNELSAYYAYAPPTTVNGKNSIPTSFGGGEANIKLSENLLGVAYAWKY
ncbi:MAG: outer membrane protein transport protein [Pseudoxanthomonas sp.]